ncbi:DUF6907 domain-containing protein [Streptomyces sp. NPDC088732]|uniref:DUF6907 domain-containing protein n=1 Tax=Streptomyces sp. NPDC088732 TaxID=3365879 RepID=UPI00380FEAD8
MRIVSPQAAGTQPTQAQRSTTVPARGTAGSILTAAERGVEWTARYGCFAECVLDHAGADGEPGWHQAAAANLTAPSGCKPAGTVLTSRVTQVSQDADAFGVETKAWVDFEYRDILELTLPQAHEFAAGLRNFLTEFETSLALLEKLAVADRPGDPEVKAQHMADVEARIQAVNAAELYVFLQDHGIALEAADGPNADALTEPVLVDLEDGPALLAPPGATPGALLLYVHDAVVRRAVQA